MGSNPGFPAREDLAPETVVNGSAIEAEFAEIEAISIGVNQMWMKIGPAAILAAFLAGTADLGYAPAADGRDGRAKSAGTGNGGPAVRGGPSPPSGS